MCLGMANGYRVPEKENVNEDTKMTDKEIIKALEEWRKEIIDDYQRLQLLGAPMDCFEESHADTVTKLSNAIDLINRCKTENQKLTKKVADLKRKLAKSPENRFACCVSVEYGEIYTRSLADYDKLLNDIKKCLIEDLERACKARKLVITHEPVRYVRIPLHLFEKLVDSEVKKK